VHISIFWLLLFVVTKYTFNLLSAFVIRVGEIALHGLIFQCIYAVTETSGRESGLHILALTVLNS